MIKLTQLLNELGISSPGRASLAQLKRWQAEIQASDDTMTQIKLALKCAEGVIWIWREKYPTDNRPQAALNAVKAYIKDPSEENKQKCAKAADDAYDAYDAAYDDAVVYITDAAANVVYVAANVAAAAVYAVYTNVAAAAAAANAIHALTIYKNK